MAEQSRRACAMIYCDDGVYSAEIPIEGTVFGQAGASHPRAKDGLVVGYGNEPEAALADAMHALGIVGLDRMIIKR